MGTIALWLALACAASAAAQAKRPNIVFLDVCSARADHFGAYGYRRATTPNIDRLSKRSAVFENAMAQSSWCLPNYATLFTGHVPEVHGDYTNKPHVLPEFETTLARKLKAGGYRTAAFSGGVYMIPEWGLADGFDDYVSIFSTADAEHLPASFAENLGPVVDFVKREKEAPFFLYVAIDDLHAPYRSKDPDLYDPGYSGVAHDTETLGVPFSRAYNGEPGDYSPGLLAKLSSFRKDPRGLKHLTAHYDAALNQVDDEVGRLVRRLEALGRGRDTIIVLTGDHGEMLGEHGLLGHTEGLYQPVLNVPLIVYDPQLPYSAGRRYRQLIERVDMMPTLLEMAGLAPSGLGLQGRSFLPLLEGPSAPWREYAFAASKRNLAKLDDLLIDERAVRDERWKLIQYLYKPAFELYDLKSDPGETKDVSRERTDVVARLSFELLRNMELTRPHAPGAPEGLEPPAAPLQAGLPKD